MLSFLSPLWLLGLALLPVIRWLHRGGQHRRDVAVSRLALWRGSEVARAEAGARRPPDPAWRRRALLTALLFLVLAGPQWPEKRVRVTVWIDDSLSMLTREADGPRLIVGLSQVRSQLARFPGAEVELRSLSDPWLRLGALDDAVVATLVRGAGRREPSAPPAALLPNDRQQWLLTDGADASLFEWPGGRRPDRVLQVGSVRRNVGIERLSARRQADDAAQVDLLLKVTNGGTSAEERTVVVATGITERARRPVRLEAGTSQLVAVSIPASPEVHAALLPGDALVEDDTIALALTPLRQRRIALDPRCPGALQTALKAHPAVAVVPPGTAGADALVACADAALMGDLPKIRIVADRTPVAPAGLVEWSADVPDSRRLALDAGHLRLAARLQARPGDIVLLAVGDEPVAVVRRGQAMLIETSLDFAAMSATRGAATPLLVNLLLERLLDRRVLDEIVSVDRGPRSSLVAPLPRPSAPAVDDGPVTARAVRDDSRLVLAVALLAMLWEIGALVRQARRLREPQEARAS
ncbi:MAG: BatA domain-containing protein [Caldimonas sp.]